MIHRERDSSLPLHRYFLGEQTKRFLSLFIRLDTFFNLENNSLKIYVSRHITNKTIYIHFSRCFTLVTFTFKNSSIMNQRFEKREQFKKKQNNNHSSNLSIKITNNKKP